MSTKSKDNSNLSLFVVDAFTDTPFSGNSAAVILQPFNKVLCKTVKQKIAAEMNLSESAFINIKSKTCSFEEGKTFGLEWFTPTCEVPLCGHATLASAYVLFAVLGNQSNELEFETASGILKAKYLEDKKIGIDLPTYDSKPVNEKYHTLIKAVVGSLIVDDIVLSSVPKKLLIRLSDKVSRQELESLQVRESELLSAAPDGSVRGVIVTLNVSNKDDCKDQLGKQYDFISRYFAPWNGIPEDPVTGSAHSVLAPYWSKILNKKNLYARQCSHRGGDLTIELIEDRVHLSGHAALVIQGQISF